MKIERIWNLMVAPDARFCGRIVTRVALLRRDTRFAVLLHWEEIRR
jgi:hypothetical protein